MLEISAVSFQFPKKAPEKSISQMKQQTSCSNVSEREILGQGSHVLGHS